MTTATKQQSDPNVLAVLHQTGRVCRGVIARRDGNGRAEHESLPTLLDSREFTAEQQGQIAGWLDEHRVGEVIGVLHASSVICRTCTLPNASEDQLLPALRLQAESHLLGIAPPHRVGMSVIEAAPGETSRIGLVLAWPESRGTSVSEGDVVATKPASLASVDRPMTYSSDIAGLAALLNGYRPTQPMLWVDRADGSCAVAMTHANGAVFRAVREDEQDPEQWKQSIGRALAETALNVGHSSSFIEAMVRLTHERMETVVSDGAGLFVPDEVIEHAAARLDGGPTEVQWWDRFGIAAGVVLARCGKLAGLTQLREDEPQEHPSAIRTAAEFLSRPSTARYAVLACILVLLLGPLVMNGLRLGVLKAQHGALADRLEAMAETENKLVVYRQLHSDTWPMTKILADIASCTPEGIELENIHVRQQQTFTLSGRALPTDDRSAPQVVELMRERLRATGIFSDITLNWGQGDAYGNYEFGLNARLHRPFLRYDYPEEQDFAQWTLADRRDGIRAGTERNRDEAMVSPAELVGELAEGMRGFDEMVGEPREREHDDRDRAHAGRTGEQPEADARPSRPARPSPAVDRGGAMGGEAGSPRDDRGRGGVRPSEDIPEPLTEDEIRQMSQPEVTDMLIKISGARQIARRGDDEELKERLQREFDLLMERMREHGD